MRKVFLLLGVAAIATAGAASAPAIGATDYACHEEFVPDPLPPEWNCDDVGNPNEDLPPPPPPAPDPWPWG